MEPTRKEGLSFSRTECLLGQPKMGAGANAQASRLDVALSSHCDCLRPHPATYGMRTSYIVFKAGLTEPIHLTILYLTVLETFMAQPRLGDFRLIVSLPGSVAVRLGN